MTFFNNTFLVLGLSKTGISVAKYLRSQGAKVLLTEGKQADAHTIKELEDMGIRVEAGTHSDEFINQATIAITSPGIPPYSVIISKLKSKNIEVISELELAYRVSKTPYIVITGTNGKTTTTALAEHIFKTTYSAKACGNYGLPVCDIITENLDYYICEASSYQLEMSPTLSAKIAIFTNFTPDHLEWHQGLDNYFNAKAKIFDKSQYAILNAQDKKLVELSKNIKTNLYFFDGNVGNNCSYIKEDAIYYAQDGNAQKIIDIKDCSLIGHHNYQNIMCVIIAAKIAGIKTEDIVKCLKDFQSPEHRLELFASTQQTKFYNDSKATNPEASIVAIKSFNSNDNNVLIAGGTDKNTSLDEFCACVKKHIKTVVLIGDASSRFSTELIKSGFCDIIIATSMQDAVTKSINLNADNVLLSPACASFDMYKNYEQRGQDFKDLVLNLI